MRFFPEIARDRSRQDAPATVGSLAARLRLVATAIADRAALPNPSVALATALTVLWTRAHSFDAADPAWPDRDRFVLSHAPATPLFYALLHLTGHAGMDADALAHCGDLDAVASSAAEQGSHGAVEACAAPAGQAIAIAVGMAQAERALAARFGKSLVDHRVWAVAHAAELGNGIVTEAICLAGLAKLDRLALLVDATDKQAEDARPRFAASGWTVKAADAEDPQALDAALSYAQRSRKPTLIWCEPDSLKQAPPAAEEAWRLHGGNGASTRRAWLKRIARHPQRAEFERVTAGRLPDGWNAALAVCGKAASPAEAASLLLAKLPAAMPELLAGRLEGALDALPETPRLVSHGRRPHGMAAIANGASLHAGVLPLTAGALLDTAEQLPALRLAAIGRYRVVHLCIDHGLAAPGRAWQPACLLAMLRTLPGLAVFRPACAREATECLELALRRKDGPSLLVLSREEGVRLRGEGTENRAARGAYVLAEAPGPRAATLIATGAELRVALEARTLLAAEGIGVAVVSLPCWSLFAAQDDAYRGLVLGDALRIGIEAGARDGWNRWLGPDGLFVGDAPPVAGPSEAIRRRLGLTPEAIATLVRRTVRQPAPAPA